MNHPHTGYIYSKDQTPLFYRHYAVDGQKATVLLVHGFGEHSGRYQHVIDSLLARHFEVFSFDFRGHGQSQGARGDVERFSCFEEDLAFVVKYVLAQKAPGQKFFILAHSMGALVTLRFANQRPEGVNGMVFSAPLIALSPQIPSWQKWAARTLSKVLPTLRVSAGIKGKELSSDLKFARGYDEDPLVRKTVSVRAIAALEAGTKELSELTVKPPFFMQIPELDSLVDPKASQIWFAGAKIKNEDATMKLYPDFLHEIYNETHREAAIEDALAWIEKRL